MRVRCEECLATYILPDGVDVRAVTCSRCGHVVTEGDGGISRAAASSLGKWRTGALNGMTRNTETPIWYYSYNGGSFGPYNESDLMAQLLSEKMRPVARRCYVWNRTFTEWRPVMQVEPFASAIQAPQAPAPKSPTRQSGDLPPLSGEAGLGEAAGRNDEAAGRNDAAGEPGRGPKTANDGASKDAGAEAGKNGEILPDIDLGDEGDEGGGDAGAAGSFDDIKARHADLFADLQDDASDEEQDGSVSERSMLIQLDYINKSQSRSRLRHTLVLAGAVGGIILAAVLLYFLGRIILPDTNNGAGGIEGDDVISGRVISSDELDDALIPRDDFQIVAVQPAQQKHRQHHRKTTQQTQQDLVPGRDMLPDTGAVADAEYDGPGETDDTMAAGRGLNESVADAIYGQAKDRPARQATKSDGRANVVLDNVGTFANAAGTSGSKYIPSAGGAPSSRELFSIGLRSVSKSVRECHRREAKNGSMTDIPKVYIRITVEPTGTVDDFAIEGVRTPDTFRKCLETKRDRWKFAPFDGSPVSMRQGFVLD